MTKINITKTSGDYELNGKIRSGNFWKVEFEGGVINMVGSRTKKDVFETVENNFGSDIEITYENRV